MPLFIDTQVTPLSVERNTPAQPGTAPLVLRQMVNQSPCWFCTICCVLFAIATLLIAYTQLFGEAVFHIPFAAAKIVPLLCTTMPATVVLLKPAAPFCHCTPLFVL